jgi:hypothetical protein
MILATIGEVLLDALKDLCLILPVLFVTYYLMELLEHVAGEKTLGFLRKAKGWGPLAGGILGVIPECGVAGGVASLYAGGVITAGAFIAAVLSTSDEMLPVMLAGGRVAELAGFIGFKLVYGVAAGFAADGLSRLFVRRKWTEFAKDFGGAGAGEICSICKREGCNCGHEHGGGPEDRDGHRGHRIWLAALIHTLKVGGLIFAFSVLIGLAMEFLGLERLASLGSGIPVVAELTAALFGLIPNCSVSVALTNLYLSGVIGAGPAMAGLLTNGGAGLLVLFRINRGKDRLPGNLAICGALVAFGLAGGLLAGLIF